jgi:hypothetical protein
MRRLRILYLNWKTTSRHRCTQPGYQTNRRHFDDDATSSTNLESVGIENQRLLKQVQSESISNVIVLQNPAEQNKALLKIDIGSKNI